LANVHKCWYEDDLTESYRAVFVLPGATSWNWIKLPLRTGLSFHCRRGWEIAADVHVSWSEFGHLTRHHDLYFRASSYRRGYDIDALVSGRHGWRHQHEWAQLGREDLERRLERDRLEALAERKGIHLLECTLCREVSDLSAHRWRLELDALGLLTTVCPACSTIRLSSMGLQTPTDSDR
jgi:hypothetical protein